MSGGKGGMGFIFGRGIGIGGVWDRMNYNMWFVGEGAWEEIGAGAQGRG